MCGDDRSRTRRNADGSMHISQLDLPIELVGVLETVRTLLALQIGILKDGAQAPADVAEAWFGRGSGLEITSAVLSLVNALRQSRRSMFRFSNPACKVCREFVTEHEHLLLRIVMAMQSGNLIGARTSAIMLCEGHDENPLLKAVGNVVTLVPVIPATERPVRHVLQ